MKYYEVNDNTIVTIEDNDKVVIANVDCTAEDNLQSALCDSYGVKSYPTLNIYEEGVKVLFFFIGDILIEV